MKLQNTSQNLIQHKFLVMLLQISTCNRPTAACSNFISTNTQLTTYSESTLYKFIQFVCFYRTMSTMHKQNLWYWQLARE